MSVKKLIEHQLTKSYSSGVMPNVCVPNFEFG